MKFIDLVLQGTRDFEGLYFDGISKSDIRQKCPIAMHINFEDVEEAIFYAREIVECYRSSEDIDIKTAMRLCLSSGAAWREEDDMVGV